MANEKITFEPKQSSIEKYRKEKGFFEEYTLISFDEKDKFKEILTLRLYRTNNTVFAVVWASNDKKEELKGGRGAGKSSGSGYNKTNDAADLALINAGFTFTDSKSAESEGVEKIIAEIAKDIYNLKNFYILNAHG